MLTEEEKRLHRCCFSGHRPEKLEEPEEQIKAWLETQIRAAISSGFTTFISGCAMGVDIWAGQIVIRLRDEEKVKMGSSFLRLIAATPWPGFSNRWSIDWQEQYSHLLRDADLSVPIANHYSKDVFQKRNEWMVDHSNRVIAYYNGAPGGTRDAIEYAEKKGVEVITNNPDYKPKERKQKKAVAEKIAYPENLVTDIGLNLVFDDGVYQELTADQIDGLDHALSTILPREKDIILLRYQEQKTLQEIGDQYGVTKERIRQIVNKALRKLQHQSRIVLIKSGYKDGELKLKIECAEEIKKQLQVQKKRYPEMNEEDVVKFVFQGMLGNGHLVKNVKVAEERLRAELEVLEADKAEPLIEKISTDWVRMNLRRAKADGLKVEDIAWYLVRSAEWGALSFKRQNVYNFCVKMDGSEAMKATAAKVLDENWLPSHSEAYKEAYKPAYRVLYKDYRKFKKEEN